MRVKRLWVWVLLYASAVAQPGGSDAVAAAIERDGCTSLQPSKIKVCRYNYAVDNWPVEAISFQPSGEGPFPGALLIPGHERTAKDQIALGVWLAAADGARQESRSRFFPAASTASGRRSAI